MDHRNVQNNKKRYKLYAEDPSIPIPPSTRYYQKLKRMSKLEVFELYKNINLWEHIKIYK